MLAGIVEEVEAHAVGCIVAEAETRVGEAERPAGALGAELRGRWTRTGRPGGPEETGGKPDVGVPDHIAPAVGWRHTGRSARPACGHRGAGSWRRWKAPRSSCRWRAHCRSRRLPGSPRGATRGRPTPRGWPMRGFMNARAGCDQGFTKASSSRAAWSWDAAHAHCRIRPWRLPLATQHAAVPQRL